jgi:hypothetical protein
MDGSTIIFRPDLLHIVGGVTNQCAKLDQLLAAGAVYLVAVSLSRRRRDEREPD